MTTLTFVRHGQTDWNLALRIQGSTDIPLNDSGRAQARVVATELRGHGDTVIVASPLRRASETAGIIATELGLEAPRLYPDLRERNYGEAEGMLVAEFRRRFGEDDAVPGAESRADLLSRGLRAVRRVTADVRRDTAPAAASVIVVSHGALIRELIHHSTGGALPLAGERLPNGSAYSFLVERHSLRLLSYATVAA